MESYQEFWIWTIESGWSWSGCSTTSADSWIDICGDGEGAAVKDDATIVFKLSLYHKTITMKRFFYELTLFQQSFKKFPKEKLLSNLNNQFTNE